MNDETKRQSVFMQMHNGTQTGQGSFNVALKELFYKADNSNKRKLVKAFPDFFGDEAPEFGIYSGQQEAGRDMSTQAGVSDKKMNIHLHLRDVSPQNLEKSLRDSEEMISNLSPLIYGMLQKYQDNTQRDNNDQPCAFRFLLQSRKCDIEVLPSQSREASTGVNDLYDRL